LSVNSSLFNLPHWNYLANWNQILVECLEGSLQKTLILIWFNKKHGRYWVPVYRGEDYFCIFANQEKEPPMAAIFLSDQNGMKTFFKRTA
jgi:hypothetical protein